ASDICEIGGWFRPTQGSLVRAASALSEVDRILRRHQLGLSRPLFVERTSGRILVHAGFIASLNHRSRTRPPVWESVDTCVFVAASQSKAVLRPVARWRIRRQLLRAGSQDGLRSTADRVTSFRW